MVATTEYFTNGSTILAEKTGDNIIWYIYDSDLLGFTYNGTPYYYVKNVQGDVYKVVNSNGQVVASYTYDAWGKVIAVTNTAGAGQPNIAEINPIRYRGYYYDSETVLYYLNSRYYDPETGRFVNADSYVSTGQGILGNNMFAYCLNNPVNGCDPYGTMVRKLWNSFKKAYNKAIDFITNDDEATAQQNIQDHGIAFYKGVPVIKEISWLNLLPERSAFSYGVIVMDE